jgi:cholesterol transport system auxiliary component
MIRSTLAALVLLCAACVSHRAEPALYDFDSIESPADPSPKLDATIAIPEVTAPNWMRSSALYYRLDYEPPSHPQAYAHSQWASPPPDLVTLRLRELIGGVNAGFTTPRLEGMSAGYRLEVELDEFIQAFSSSSASQCIVTLNAMVVDRNGRILGERTFHAQRIAPTANAQGAVRGLVEATDDNISQLLAWLPSTLHT